MSAAYTRGTATGKVKRFLLDYQDHASSPEILCCGGRTREGIIGFRLAFLWLSQRLACGNTPMAKARQFSKKLKIEDKGPLVERYEMSMHSGSWVLAPAYVT